MGMLIFRANWIIKNKLGLLSMSVLLMLAFLTPYNENWSWIIEPIIVIFYFPLLVSLGAGASLASKYQKINTLSGEISYPLYMTHYPFMWIFANYLTVEKPSMADLWIVIPASVILLILLSYFIFKFLDFPIRSYFTDKLKTSLSK